MQDLEAFLWTNTWDELDQNWTWMLTSKTWFMCPSSRYIDPLATMTLLISRQDCGWKLKTCCQYHMNLSLLVYLTPSLSFFILNRFNSKWLPVLPLHALYTFLKDHVNNYSHWHDVTLLTHSCISQLEQSFQTKGWVIECLLLDSLYHLIPYQLLFS